MVTCYKITLLLLTMGSATAWVVTGAKYMVGDYDAHFETIALAPI